MRVSVPVTWKSSASVEPARPAEPMRIAPDTGWATGVRFPCEGCSEEEMRHDSRKEGRTVAWPIAGISMGPMIPLRLSDLSLLDLLSGSCPKTGRNPSAVGAYGNSSLGRNSGQLARALGHGHGRLFMFRPCSSWPLSWGLRLRESSVSFPTHSVRSFEVGSRRPGEPNPRSLGAVVECKRMSR